MKRQKIIFTLLLLFVLMPVVNVAAASTIRLSGTNNIKVGETTTIYIESNSNIKGAEFTYSTSDNIEVVNTKAVSGMKIVNQKNNSVKLTSKDFVSSENSFFEITVKGVDEGNGTIYVSNVELSGEDKNIKASSASLMIKVESESEEETIVDDEKKLDDSNLAKAKLLVEASERSLMDDDYEAALDIVNELPDSEEKTAFLDRLDKVKFDMAVKKVCKEQETKVEPACKKVDNNSKFKKWRLLSIVSILVCIVELAYIILISKKCETTEKKFVYVKQNLEPNKTRTKKTKNSSINKKKSE